MASAELTTTEFTAPQPQAEAAIAEKDEVDDNAKEGTAGAKSDKKKKKKKAAKKEDAPAPAAKKPTGALAALKAAMEQKRPAKEEAKRRAEEERGRIEEEGRKAEEEERLREEAKQKRKEKEKVGYFLILTPSTSLIYLLFSSRLNGNKLSWKVGFSLKGRRKRKRLLKSGRRHSFNLVSKFRGCRSSRIHRTVALLHRKKLRMVIGRKRIPLCLRTRRNHIRK